MRLLLDYFLHCTARCSFQAMEIDLISREYLLATDEQAIYEYGNSLGRPEVTMVVPLDVKVLMAFQG